MQTRGHIQTWLQLQAVVKKVQAPSRPINQTMQTDYFQYIFYHQTFYAPIVNSGIKMVELLRMSLFLKTIIKHDTNEEKNEVNMFRLKDFFSTKSLRI